MAYRPNDGHSPREGIRSREYGCPRDDDNAGFVDNSRDGEHPVDGDCTTDCEVLLILTILRIVTVLGIMTALGMVTFLEHVLLHCTTSHCLELYWHCQRNLSYAKNRYLGNFP